MITAEHKRQHAKSSHNSACVHIQLPRTGLWKSGNRIPSTPAFAKRGQRFRANPLFCKGFARFTSQIEVDARIIHNRECAVMFSSNHRTPGLLLCCVIVLSSSAFLLGADDSKRVFRAGAAAVDVTPVKFPVIVNGYFNERQVDRAQDRSSSSTI